MAHRKVNKHFFFITNIPKKKCFKYDYEFYVDASFRLFEIPYKHTFSAYSFLMVNEDNINKIFISEKLPDIKDSRNAEAIGIYNVIKYIRHRRNIFKDKKVIIYSDCSMAIDTINNLGILKDDILLEYRSRETKYIKIVDKLAKTTSKNVSYKGYVKKANKQLKNMGIVHFAQIINNSITKFN